jgi:hypothetical protein
MSAVLEVLAAVAGDVWVTIAHNWPYLLAAVVVAAALQVYVGTDHLAAWLRRRTGVAVLAAVAVASLTPFCSCGTTAVVLGAMASAVPWAPVVAFMVSSPLTSPGEYVMSAGLFGPAFATTYFLAAIVIGLVAGGMTALVERTGWLVGQARMATPGGGAVVRAGRVPVEAGSSGTTSDDAAASCACGGDGAVPNRQVEAGGRTSLALLEAPTGCCLAVDADAAAVAVATVDAAGGCDAGCGSAEVVAALSRHALFGQALLENARRLAVYFIAFAALGYLIIELVPTEVLTTYLGGDSLWSVPLAATLGIPVYVNGDASLPMIASLMDGGMGAGPALAFLVTGAGTSVGAFSGMLVIARWRVVALVVGSLWAGSIVLGYLAPLWL